jgi:hypothetical protein
MLTYSIILLIDEQFSYYTAHHWAVATSVSTYIVASLPLPLYCGILLLEKQHETKLVSILYCSLMSSSCIILLIIQQLRLPCSSWSSYCNILYPCSFFYLRELTKLYWCVVWRGLGAWWLPCHYMISLSFSAASCRLLWLRHHANFTAAWSAAAASCRLYLRHYCRLDSSSHRTTCGITADLSDLYTAQGWAVAASMSSYIFIVASMPLPHSCGIMLPWKQYETLQDLSCSITANFDCGIMPTLLAALLPTRFVIS